MVFNVPEQQYDVVDRIVRELVQDMWFEVVVSGGSSMFERPNGPPQPFPIHLVGHLDAPLGEINGDARRLRITAVPFLFPYASLPVGVRLIGRCSAVLVDDLGGRGGLGFTC